MSLTPPTPSDAERAQRIKTAAGELNALIQDAHNNGITTGIEVYDKTGIDGIVKLVDVTVSRRL